MVWFENAIVFAGLLLCGLGLGWLLVDIHKQLKRYDELMVTKDDDEE